MEEEIIKKHYEEYKALCIDAMFIVDENKIKDPKKYFRALICDKNLIRFVDKDGKQVNNGLYRNAKHISNGYVAVSVNKKWQILRLNGEPLTDKLFDEVGNCSDEFIAVRVGEYWNYLGIDGRILSNAKYERVQDFKDGLAIVRQNNQDLLINKDGKVLTKEIFKLDSISEFQNGYAMVSKNGKYNFIDRNGNLLPGVFWQSANDRYGKDAAKDWYDFVNNFNDGYALVQKFGRWNFLSANGCFLFKEWIEADYMHSFHEGYSAIQRNGKWNFINKEGKLLLKNGYSEVFSFKNGYAIVRNGAKWNLINQDGVLYFDKWLDYKICNILENGNCVVNNNGEHFKGDYFLVDKMGQLIPKTNSSSYLIYSNGLSEIHYDDKWNYMDINGNLLSKEWFDFVFFFSDGYGLVKRNNNKYNFIDKNGYMLLDEWCDDAEPFENGYASITKNDYYYVIDKSGSIVSEKLKSQNKIIFFEETPDEYTYMPNITEEDYNKSLIGYTIKNKNINIKYKPFYIFENHVICYDEKNYYLYNIKNNSYYVIGEKASIIIRENCIINQKTDKVYYLDSDKEDLLDITTIYWKKELNKRYFDYNYIDILTYTEFKSKMLENEDFCKFIADEKVKLQALLEERRIKDSQARIEEETLKREHEEKLMKEERLKKLTEALNGLRKYISIISELSKNTKIEAPQVLVSEEDILIKVGDHKEFAEWCRGILRFLDLSGINFTNVLVSGIDFQDTNATINPQKVYNKDMSNGNFTGIIFGAFSNFNGVDIRGAKFGKGMAKESGLDFVRFDGAITDDRTIIDMADKQR